MRRATILLATIALAVVVGSGVAVAATIRCDGGRCVGTNRPDTMFGTNRHDAVFARDGGDLVGGRGGADNLNGQDGDDEILGGWGDDWVKGGMHDDAVEGGLGNDRITGGSGDNIIRAGDGRRDHIVCGDNSWNLIFFDPRLDRFSNCEFLSRGPHGNRMKGSVASVVGVDASRVSLGSSILFRAFRPLRMLGGIFNHR